jgi:elongation factor G
MSENMSENISELVRNIAIVGPYLSGKTTLLESLLYVTGSISRKGKVTEKNTVGDSSPEARERSMGVEVNVAHLSYEDVQFNFMDCPGSVEFIGETHQALIGVDAAIVVCEPVIDRINTLAPLFQFLDNWQIPHVVFINKMDRACSEDSCHAPSFLAFVAALQKISSRPLAPQQYPLSRNEQIMGFVDLITEQAYQYAPKNPPQPIPLDANITEAEHLLREQMLETLSQFDDHLLEELLEDIQPPISEILTDFQKELAADQIVPVFFGIAEMDYGVRPLLKAIATEAPLPSSTAARRPELKAYPRHATVAQVLKTSYSQQGGKISLVRLWQGQLKDGESLNGNRMGGMYHLMGAQQQPIVQAQAGDIIAIARLESAKTGDTLLGNGLGNGLGTDAPTMKLPMATLPQPVYAWAVMATNRNDEVKLGTALNRLCEEDSSLHWEQHGDTHEVILWGQGEIHLQVAMERMRRKYNLPMTNHFPQVPYKETIRKGGASHGRYKHQSGGHGQFGDVYLNLKPTERGTGFKFDETIVGGVVPRQYIPGVETGVREFLNKGPLGFPVVDIAVTLTNGSYHSVDSSEQAFKQAARLAMQEGMRKCEPVLLEPVDLVEISIPSSYTASVLRLVTGRRGQILGYEAKPHWQNWDVITVYLPVADQHNLIVEIRSLTMGVGFFERQFNHLQEVPDKIAERILN